MNFHVALLHVALLLRYRLLSITHQQRKKPTQKMYSSNPPTDGKGYRQTRRGMAGACGDHWFSSLHGDRTKRLCLEGRKEGTTFQLYTTGTTRQHIVRVVTFDLMKTLLANLGFLSTDLRIGCQLESQAHEVPPT